MGRRDISMMLAPTAMAAMLAMSAGASGPDQDLTAQVLGMTAPGGQLPVKPPEVKSATKLIEEYLGANLGLEAGAHTRPLVAPPIVTLIATFPDPRASRFAGSFDDRLGALQRAAEAGGYLLDRFSLPWVPGQEANTAMSDPGVLLFRRHQQDGLLVVWVVGETPTTGVHKPALIKALGELQALTGHHPETPATAKATEATSPAGCSAERPSWAAHTTEATAVRILGPTFSGSWQSLDIALGMWTTCVGALTGKPPVLRVISGSATAIPKSPSTDAPVQIAGAPFKATLLRDEDALCSFLGYLKEQHTVPARKVALLVEANTAYGRGMADRAAAPCPALAADDQPLRISFPLHLAQLRAQSSEAPSTPPLTLSTAKSSRLSSIELESEGNTIEIPASQGKHTAGAANVLLVEALRQLATSGVAYIGILASDIQDTILLTRELRKHVPNATLFTLSGDVLFLHPDVNRSFTGTLVISAYSLASLPGVHAVPFSQDMAATPASTDLGLGIYNAFTALVGSGPLFEYENPLASPHSRPPYWMTVVGRDAFWPVRRLRAPPTELTAYYYTPDTANRQTPPSSGSPSAPLGVVHAVHLAYICWCGGCLTLLYMLGFGLDAPKGRFRWLTGQDGFARRLLLLGTLAALVIIQLLGTTMLSISLIASSQETEVGWQIASLLAIVLAVGTSLLLAYTGGSTITALYSLRKGGTECSSLLRALIVLASIAGPGITAVLCLRWLTQSPFDRLFLLSRSAALLSGVSPLVPLVLAAMASVSCSIAGVRRLRICDDFVPLRTGAKTSLQGIEEREAMLRETFDAEPSALRGFAIVMLLLIVAWAVLFLTGFAPPSEVPVFNVLFVIGFLIVYLSLSSEFVRFVSGWIELRGYLNRVSWHPISAVFADVRQVEPAAPSISLTQVSHPMTVLTFAAARLREFIDVAAAASPAAAAGSLAARTGSLTDRLNRLMATLDASLANAARADLSGDTVAAVSERRQASKAVRAATTQVLITLGDRLSEVRPSTGGVVPPGDPAILHAGAMVFAARSITVIHYVFRQLQNLLTLVLLGVLLMLTAVTLYPFQPHEWLILFNWGIVTTVIAGAMVIFVQIDRDRVMSLLSGTTPGNVVFDREFFLRTFLFVIVPLLTMLGANFPDGFSKLIDWLRGQNLGN